MSDDAIPIARSNAERCFVDSRIATGKYADDAEILHAGLAALEREWKFLDLRQMIATAHEGNDVAQYVEDNADGLRRELANAEASGESGLQIPDIINAVKKRLRADGAL